MRVREPLAVLQAVWPVKKTFYHIDTMTELELYLQHIVYPEIYAPSGPVFSQYLGTKHTHFGMLLPSAEVRVLLSGAAEWYRMWIGVEVCRGTECSCAGGARIRQLRVIDDNCTTTISPGLLTHSETFSFPCFLGFGDDTEDDIILNYR